MRYRIPDWSKGLNLDSLPSELAPGFCSAAGNVRFRYGFAVRVGGILEMNSAPGTQPTWINVYQTSVAALGVYAFLGSASKAYAYNFIGTTSEITRYTEGAAIASITHAGTTAVVTTSSNHGRTTGDTVSVWGATPDAYNGTFVVTVTGVATFAYSMASDPGANATAVGLYSYDGATSDFSSGTWTGGNLNGVFIANHAVNGLYYWAGGTSIRLRKMPNSYVARAARPWGNYIIQMAPTVAGTQYLYKIAWTNSAEPGAIPTTLTASDTNDAGDVEKPTTGTLVDGLEMGDSFIVYATNGRYRMDYVGGNDVFRFTKLPGTDGLFAAGCVVDTPLGHVFLNKNFEVLLHSGGACKNLSSGRIAAGLTLQSGTTFLVTHPRFNEVWVVVPNSGGTVDTAYIWNWTEDTWGVKTLATGTFACGSSSGLGAYQVGEQLVFALSSSKVGIQDLSATDVGTSFNSYVERTGLDLGEPDLLKTLQRSRWNIDGIAGATFTVSHGSAKTAAATPTYASGATYTLGTTDYAAARATQGKYLAVKLLWTSSSTSAPGRVRSCDLDWTAGGSR